MSRQQHWPEPAVALLKQLWADHSAAVIVRRLAAECGFAVTRNAVIGKAHRLGLPIKHSNKVELPQPTRTAWSFRGPRK